MVRLQTDQVMLAMDNLNDLIKEKIEVIKDYQKQEKN